MRFFINIIFFFIAVTHLNIISSAGTFSFGENHVHVEFEEFNYHTDDADSQQVEETHHKHRHQKNEKEHEHTHLLNLEHKEILFTSSINIFNEPAFIKTDSHFYTNNLKLSDTNVEVFRPPIA